MAATITQTVQVPPQPTPISDYSKDVEFSIVWWKSFDLMARKLIDLQDQINALLPGTFSSYIDDVTLTHGATTNITSAITPNEGDLLTVFITEPSNAGGQITWDAIFQGVGPDTLDPRANAVSAVSFKGRSDNLWWFTGFEAY